MTSSINEVSGELQLKCIEIAQSNLTKVKGSGPLRVPASLRFKCQP